MPFTSLRGPSLNGASDGRISFARYGLQIDMWLSLANDHPQGPLSLSGYRPTAQDGETNAYNRAASFLFSRRQLPIIIWYLLFHLFFVFLAKIICERTQGIRIKRIEHPLRRRFCVFDLIDINHWTEVFLRTMVVGFKLSDSGHRMKGRWLFCL
jgi:hypothetical protein